VKTKGLIQVYTGDGKGKTTAALGVALRILGHGGRVGVVQFFKSATVNDQRSTKNKSLRVARCALNRHHDAALVAIEKYFGSRLKTWSFGGGFTWSVAREENTKAVQNAWKKCCELLKDPKYNLVILDEIHIALHYKFLKVSDVVKVLKSRRPGQHVILTGRNAPQTIIRLADLVTEMKCVKHPFTCGVLAQPGIEF